MSAASALAQRTRARYYTDLMRAGNLRNPAHAREPGKKALQFFFFFFLDQIPDTDETSTSPPTPQRSGDVSRGIRLIPRGTDARCVARARSGRTRGGVHVQDVIVALLGGCLLDDPANNVVPLLEVLLLRTCNVHIYVSSRYSQHGSPVQAKQSEAARTQSSRTCFSSAVRVE